jgi:hypothetical protein
VTLPLVFSFLVLYFFAGTPEGFIRHDKTWADYASYAQEVHFEPVGRVRPASGGDTWGSFVLIHQAYALTSAHIFFDYQLQDSIKPNGYITHKTYRERKIPPTAFRFEIGGKVYRSKKIIIHPEFRGGMGPDLAVVKFSRPVKKIEPAILYDGDEELGKTGHWCGFGFGADAYGKRWKGLGSTPKMAGMNALDSIAGHLMQQSADQPSSMLLLADFDHPYNSKLNAMGDVKPENLEFFPSGGDSGGGVFCEIEGVWQLVGIIHATRINRFKLRTQGLYGSTCSATRVATFTEWIRHCITD